MIIKNAELEAIAVKPAQYPSNELFEIAFAGRSNVGKSSLLNFLTNRKKLAHISGSPGKTRTINFYNINGEFRIVDLPGYGYAKVSKSVSEDWGRMMETYFKNRPNLLGVVQLVDIRHEPSELDIQMYEYLKHYGMDGTVVATKADKVSQNQLQKRISTIRKAFDLSPYDSVIPVSALKKSGRQQVLQAIEDLLDDGAD